MIRRFLRWVVRFLPAPRVIVGGDGQPYLSRWTLFNFPGGRRHLYLHCFHRSDEDRDLHNHPWMRSRSLVLAGGYREERVCEEDVFRVVRAKLEHAIAATGGVPLAYVTTGPATLRRTTKVCRPGSFNTIDPDTFHRVDLLDGGAWTLFLTGTATQDWGFLDTEFNIYYDQQTYIRAKGLVPIADDH